MRGRSVWGCNENLMYLGWDGTYCCSCLVNVFNAFTSFGIALDLLPRTSAVDLKGRVYLEASLHALRATNHVLLLYIRESICTERSSLQTQGDSEVGTCRRNILLVETH